MCAGFHDVAVAHDQYVVGVLDGGESVRDDEAGLVLHQLEHGGLYAALGLGIDVGGRLVQDQHVRLEQHGAGDGDELLLPLGDVAAVFGDHGVVALGQLLDKVVDVRHFGGVLHLFKGGFVTAVGDVFVDGASEQPGFLQHHRVGGAQVGAFDLLNLVVVDVDRAPLLVVKAHQQVDDRGLARAGGADNGRDRAGRGAERQVVQDDLAGFIAEGNVLHAHVALRLGQGNAVRRVLGLAGLVDQAEHALARRQCRLKLGDDVGHLVDGAGELARVQHEGGNLPQRHPPEQEQHRAEHAHEGQRQVVDEVDRRAGDAAVVFRAVVGLHGVLVALVKAVDHGLLAVVGLGGAQAGDHLLDIAVEHAQLAGALAEQRPGAFGDVAGDDHAQRHGDHEHQQQDGRNRQHHQQRAHDGDDAREHLNDVVGQRGVHRVDVVGQAGEYVADGVGVGVADGQAGNALEGVLPHAVDDLLGQADHDHRNEVGKQRGQHVEHDHQPGVQPDRVKVHAAFAGDRVDGCAGELGADQVEQVAANGQRQRQNERPAVLPDIMPELFEQVARVARLRVHGIGDVVLRHSSDLPSACARFPDTLCRWPAAARGCPGR